MRSMSENERTALCVDMAAEWMKSEGFLNPHVEPYLNLAALAIAALLEFKTYDAVVHAVERSNNDVARLADGSRCPDWFVSDVLQLTEGLSKVMQDVRDAHSRGVL